MIRAKPVLLPFLLLLLVGAGDDPPPTPAERIAKLREKCADEHADLGAFADRKDLGRAARAHYLAAIRLDPDCRKARSRLRHRRDGESWDTSREKEFADGKGAVEKSGKEFDERETKLVAEEAEAFEALGTALLAEGEAELARELLLHAHFLAPSREAAARGLGLVPFLKRFAREEHAKFALTFSQAMSAGGANYLGGVVGARTESRICGGVTAETARGGDAAAELAILAQRAIALTCRHFDVPAPGGGWVWLVHASDMNEFQRFLTGVGFGGNDLAMCMQLGTARFYQPRHCIAVAGGDPVGNAPVFLHAAVEDALWQYGGAEVPSWLHEAVAVDATLTVLNHPGTVCVVFEESQGLVMKERFDSPDAWPALLVRRAAVNDLPRMEHMRTAQIQALGLEDILAAHAYYRLLLLTRPEGLGRYLAGIGEDRPELEAFESAFGTTHEALTKELVSVLLGR